MEDRISAASAAPRPGWRAWFDRFSGGKFYDLLAGAPIVAWTLLCARQQVSALVDFVAANDFHSADALVLARMAAKCAALVFVALLLVLLPIRRTPRRKAEGWPPRVMAIGGTYLGVSLMLLPETNLGWQADLASALLVFAGTCVALYALWWLGRSISLMPEARRLVVSGPYAVIRHPLYLGEAMTLIGVLLQYFSLAAVSLAALQLAFQFARMKYEEGVLALAFPDYGDYLGRTRRLIPGLY